MADPAKHKSVSVPIAAWRKANYLKDKIVNGTELSISKVIESTINEKAKKHGYKKRKSGLKYFVRRVKVMVFIVCLIT